MADYDSGLPIRTELNGDAIVSICDASTTTQTLGVDANGKIDINTIATLTDITNTVDVSDSVAQGSLSNIDTSTAGIKTQTDKLTFDGNSSQYIAQYSGDVFEVHFTETGAGDEIHDYNTVASLAKDASTTHTYTVTGGKTLYLHEIYASASGKIKIEVKTGVSASETTKFVGFNSTANPVIWFKLNIPIVEPETNKVLVVITNTDNQAQDVYSTVIGLEK